MTAIEVSASGLTAQRRRLEVLVSNLVNANTTQPAGTEPYRRKDVRFHGHRSAAEFRERRLMRRWRCRGSRSLRS